MSPSKMLFFSRKTIWRWEITAGDVTLVEFFDFNCAYCKRAAPDVQALVASDPNLRVVLKDFPILGEQSVEAAKVGLAVKRLMGAVVAGEFHKRLIGLQGRADGRRAMELAEELGIDHQRLETEASGKDIETIIATNLALAQRLGLTGTPSFIVGDSIIEGEVGVELLRKAIKAARQ
ncbi:DsbA family protein [Manganibacter manganicus]|uniref:DsbA family protein n=1 Tax=Manganibacter manganicus TaxID=1873176 RepID=UPI001118A089|nr:DsbA family protein [Pseudaminobacter manganicus]